MRWIALYACLGLLVLAGCQSPASNTAAAVEPQPAPQPAPTPAVAPEPAAEAAPEPEVAAEPVPEPLAYDEGPLRAEILAMREMRMRVLESVNIPKGMESDFRMQVRISGAELPRVVRFGNLILTEVVDDTGCALVDEETYTDEEKTSTRPLAMPPERLKETGLLLTTRNKEASRGSRYIARMRGAVRLLTAEQTESLTIINPLQYLGQAIADPRLEELRLEVRLLTAEDFDQPLPPQCIAVQYKTKSEYVKSASFVDGQMQPMVYRERRLATKSGEECLTYCFQASEFTDEMQLVLETYRDLKEILVPLNIDNLELP